VKDVGIASGIGVGTGGRLSGTTVAGLGAARAATSTVSRSLDWASGAADAFEA
jgi:hypothetical protein